MTSIEVLVEEASAEPVVAAMLDRLVPGVPADVRVFQGKPDLLRKLPGRLRGYRQRLGWDALKIIVLVDRDDDDFRKLRREIEDIVASAGLTLAGVSCPDGDVLVRIACEELEAWFFGDLAALRANFPRVPTSMRDKARYRDPDGIAGGTWETMEKMLKRYGYYGAGLAKLDLASRMSATMIDYDSNRSRSFQMMCRGLRAVAPRTAG